MMPGGPSLSALEIIRISEAAADRSGAVSPNLATATSTA